MSSLYIFVDSARPDQYLNSLVHCIINEGVRNVCFLHIRWPRGREEIDDNGYSARVSAMVQILLESLAERSEYVDISGERFAISDLCALSRPERIREYYSRCRNLSISYSNKDIDYSALRLCLRGISKQKENFICDITGIRKKYLGDMVSACLVEDISGLYVFDMIERPDFARPWIMLVHNLDQNPTKRYRYINILNTEIYRNCARSVAIRNPKSIVIIVVALLILILGVGLEAWLGPASLYSSRLSLVSNISGIVGFAIALWSVRSLR